MASKSDSDFKMVLDSCAESAARGYKIASEKEKSLDKALSVAEERVLNTLVDFRASPCESEKVSEMLSEQLSDIRSSLENLRIAFHEDLMNLRENTEKFSVTLFGRTMAGKSTLMEVLTEGDGASIGKGAQRTTRDIRKYTWNDLAITDVPGIGAFEGEEDDRLAFDAAKTADLILFLLTDDAPQALEAECFRRVVELGKPVIIIMNIKVSVAESKSIKLIERDIKRGFDEERLAAVRRQFLKFAEEYGQDWSDVPFVNVHLKSAYIAQNTDDEEKAETFRLLSRIDSLKDIITNEVRSRGKFIRVKTFVDIVANPMIQTIDELTVDSHLNRSQAEVFDEKRLALVKWRRKFEKDAKKRIEAFMMKLKSELLLDIAEFSEEHYNDKYADMAWGELIKDKDIEGRCKDLLDSLELEVDDRIKETVREISSELQYVTVNAVERNFLTQTIIDSKRIVGWSSLVVGGGLSIASAIVSIVGTEAAMAALGPIGWIAAGVGLISGVTLLFLETRNTKELKARTKLENELAANMDMTCDSIWTQLEKNLSKLLKGKLDLVTGELGKISGVVTELGNTQEELAANLKEQLIGVNMSLVQETAGIIDGRQYIDSKISKVARIPGITTLLVTEEGVSIPEEFREQLRSILGEEVLILPKQDSQTKLLLASLEGIVSKEDIIVNENEEVTIKGDNKSQRTIDRIRLMRQIVEDRIIC
ncbi:MAG: 50S ribosome-binding GTPase [Saccharofermentans sp.]|nr:50S ribosome-binding GTPase [Saccharofermentans sp.]